MLDVYYVLKRGILSVEYIKTVKKLYSWIYFIKLIKFYFVMYKY